jgi:hypothetical protein
LTGSTSVNESFQSWLKDDWSIDGAREFDRACDNLTLSPVYFTAKATNDFEERKKKFSHLGNQPEDIFIRGLDDRDGRLTGRTISLDGHVHFLLLVSKV